MCSTGISPAATLGSIQTFSQIWPSGSSKLLPYMKPWSCVGVGSGLPPAAPARATIASTDSLLSWLRHRKTCAVSCASGIALLVKVFVTVGQCDHAWSEPEQRLAHTLVDHLWRRQLQGEELRQAILEMAAKAMKLNWYALVRPFDQISALRDRVGAELPLRADAGCRNTVYNNRAQTGAEYVARFLELGARHFRVEFIHESPDEVTRTLLRYRELLLGKISGADLWREFKLLNQLGVTRGQMEAAPQIIHRKV